MVLAAAAAVLVAGADGFWDAARLSGSAGATPAEVVLSLLVSMNLVLLVFNLVPAFPLDGGRIARAIAWKLTGDRHKATRVAAFIGVGFGWLLIGCGIALALFTDAVIDGIWFAALGWLLASSARGALAQTAFTEQLEGITVADVMDAEPVTIPAALPAARAYEEFFLRYQGWEWFAVVEDDGRFAGVAHRAAVEHAALRGGRGRAGARGRRRAATRCAADAPLETLLGSEPLRRLGALMAVDADGRLRGVITRAGHARAARPARPDLSAPGRALCAISPGGVSPPGRAASAGSPRTGPWRARADAGLRGPAPDLVVDERAAEHDRQLRTPLQQQRGGLEAVHARHPRVEHHGVRLERVELLERRVDAVRLPRAGPRRRRSCGSGTGRPRGRPRSGSARTPMGSGSMPNPS